MAEANENREITGYGMPPVHTQFKPGTTGNPNGRPRKYVSQLKEQGYKLSEVNDCILALMSMTQEELTGVQDNDEATMLEKTIAKAMIKSLEKGSLYSIETLLSRVHGKPKEITDITTNQVITGPIQVNILSTGFKLANNENDVDAK